MSICSRTRVSNPNGTWGYSSIIGSKVRLRSTPISNFFGTYCASDSYTVKDVWFQISLDGKAITVLELIGLEGKFFTLKDVQFVEIGSNIGGSNLKDALCGQFLGNESICGRNVNHDEWIPEDFTGYTKVEDGKIVSTYNKSEFTSVTINDLGV